MRSSHRHRAYWVWLLAACALSDPTLAPPCDSTDECETILAHHYDGHQCIESRCIRPSKPDTQAAPVDAGGGGSAVYDAGPPPDVRQPQCRRDSDCSVGEICVGGYCVTSGGNGGSDVGSNADSGPTPGSDSGPAPGSDSGPAPSSDSGPAPLSDTG